MRFTRLALPILLVALSDCSCGNAAGPNGGGGGGGNTFARIRISPAAVTLAPGATATITARCTTTADTPVACPAMSWTVAGGTRTSNSTGNDTVGVFTAGSTTGSFTLRATAAQVNGTASITIASGNTTPNLTVVPGQTFQTWRGWEVTPSAGWTVSQTAYDSLATVAANDLGITRVRLEVSGNIIESQNRPGICGNSQAYVGLNDNNNPNVVNPAGFDWLCFDQKMTNYILPLKQRVQALGRQFTLNVCYVGFSTTDAFQQTDPAEYAELVNVVLDRLKNNYGLEPDIWEVRLEPETGYKVTGTQVGQMMAAAVARVRAAGYNKVKFALPSNASANSAITYFNQALAVPGVSPGDIAELVYHRYGAPTGNTLPGIHTAAQAIGAETAMLEWFSSTEHTLWQDLTQAQVSSWAKYVLAGPYQSATVGNQLYYADVPAQRFYLRTATYYLRQYMRYIHPGDVRIGTSTALSGVEAVAFRSTTGAVTVVANAPGAQTFHIGGLPAGTYTVSYSTATALGAVGSTIVIGSGQTLSTSLPAAGTITISP